MKVILVVGGDLVIRISDKAWLFSGFVSKAGMFKSRISVSRNLPWKLAIEWYDPPTYVRCYFCKCKAMWKPC